MERAKAAGFQLYADTGLLCAHMIGPKFSTQYTYKKYWDEKNREEAEFKATQERTLAALDGAA